MIAYNRINCINFNKVSIFNLVRKQLRNTHSSVKNQQEKEMQFHFSRIIKFSFPIKLHTAANLTHREVNREWAKLLTRLQFIPNTAGKVNS